MSPRIAKHYKGAGRPTAEQSQVRRKQLLERALDLFLKKGFAQTTLDDIAATLRMTKRTIYTQYGNKEALFKAAVQQAIEIVLVTADELQALDTGDLENTLKAVALLRVKRVLSPEGMRLQRIINAETYRFPELQETLYQESVGPTVVFLTNLLQDCAARGEIDVDEPEACVGIFLSMAVGTTTRAATIRLQIGAMNIEQHVDYCVRLFLYGLLRR